MYLRFAKTLVVRKIGFMIIDNRDMVADSSFSPYAMLLPLVQYREKRLPASWD